LQSQFSFKPEVEGKKFKKKFGCENFVFACLHTEHCWSCSKHVLRYHNTWTLLVHSRLTKKTNSDSSNPATPLPAPKKQTQAFTHNPIMLNIVK
jgi:hypothetical protein